MSLRSPGHFSDGYNDVEHMSLRSPGHFYRYNNVEHFCPCDLQDIFSDIMTYNIYVLEISRTGRLHIIK